MGNWAWHAAPESSLSVLTQKRQHEMQPKTRLEEFQIGTSLNPYGHSTYVVMFRSFCYFSSQGLIKIKFGSL